MNHPTPVFEAAFDLEKLVNIANELAANYYHKQWDELSVQEQAKIGSKAWIATLIDLGSKK